MAVSEPRKPKLPPYEQSKVIAVDCEMVGCGIKGKISALGRCSIVDYHGNIIYDSYIKPPLPITDYRTQYSGIRPCDLEDAPSFTEARALLKKHLTGKYVVGHDLKNDFQALKIRPHPMLLRDTSRCVVLRYVAGISAKRKPSLKLLSGIILGKEIQQSSHCSVEDARIAMQLYRQVEDIWDSDTNPFLSDIYWTNQLSP